MKTKVIIQHKDKIIVTKNEVTNDVAEFMAGYMSGNSDFKLTHIYGQYGNELDFPDGGGPFFVPAKDDSIEDLETATISVEQEKIITMSTKTQEGQTKYKNNVLSVLSLMTQNDGKVFIGAGLVCKLPSGRELLLGHVAFKGIKKESNYGITIGWEWILENNL